MDKYDLIKLLDKCQRYDLTNEEQQFLISYYNLFQNQPDIIEAMNRGQQEELKKEIQNSIWNDILEKRQADTKVRFMNRWYVKLTASAIIVLIFFASSFYFIKRTPRVENQETLVIHQRGNRVIFLPDGSKVIVSPGSKLNYPSSFDGLSKREVFLVGQAYFDIKHHASMPFIVHTGKLETVVLGTAFNIKACAGEKYITVTVTRGKVKVIDVDKKKTIGIIARDHQIFYNKEEINAVTQTVNTDTVLAWKKQDLLCDDITIAEAAELLEEQYNVKIIVNGELIKSQRFTATFPKKDSLEQALKSICEFNGLVYKKDKKKSLVVITSDKDWDESM